MNLPGTTLFAVDDSAAESAIFPPRSPSARKKVLWRSSRQPCAGAAMAAAGGILLADWAPVAPWTALGILLAVMLGWAFRPRAWTCWLVVAAGFAVIHLFHIHAPPAETLARLLPTSPSEPARAVRAVGVVTSEPRLSASGVARFTFDLERVTLEGHTWDSHARVAAYWQNGLPKFGDRLEILGVARNIPAPRNPGEFDFAGYERRQGILSEMRFSGLTDAHTLQRGTAGLWRTTTQHFHDWMRDTLNVGLDNEPGPRAIVSTMLLGLKESPGLDDTEELFQRTGTLHYFAIDGLKLALLSALALWALAYSGLSRAWAGALSLPLLVFYALATGLGPASLRSALMAAALLSAYWLERPLLPLNGLGIAATLVLLFDTNQLFDLGFQLTFVVVLAIMVLAGPLHRWLMRFGAPDPFLPVTLFSASRRAWERVRRVAWGLVSVSLVAWVGSMPLMIWYFQVVSPVSPLANVVTFPLVWPVLVLGVISLLVAGIFSALGWIIPGVSSAGLAGAAWVNKVNALVAKLLLLTVQWFDAAPGGSFHVANPAEWTLRRSPAAEITVLDLGRARSMHLRAGKQNWLVDAAQPFDYAQSIQPYLRYRGIDRLEGLIFSQADTYHFGGAPLALDEFRPKRFIDPSPALARSARYKEFMNLLAARHLRAERCERGGMISLGPDAELHALYPPPDLKSGTSSDRALVLQLRAAGWRVLLLADAGLNVELWLLQNAAKEDLRSDALITGVAPNLLTPEFLRAVAPRVAISQYGTVLNVKPPSLPQTELPIQWRCVDDCGAVRLRLYSDKLEVEGFVDRDRMTISK